MQLVEGLVAVAVIALHSIEQRILLLQNCQADRIAAFILSDETLTSLVDEDDGIHALALIGVVLCGAILGGAGVQQLNLIHVDQVRADGFCHQDAVAGIARHAGAAHVLAQVGPLLALAVLYAHLNVARKAAGSQHNAALGCEGVCIAILVGTLYGIAHTVSQNQFFGSNAVAELHLIDVVLTQVLDVSIDELSANTAGRIMSAGEQGAGTLGDGGLELLAQ